MSQKEELPIESVADYANHLENWFDSPNYFYRGQENPWPLIPKLFRDCRADRVLKVEQEMLEEFKRSSLPYLDRPLDDPWDLISVAQHHGLPTRLLDWTSNPLAALWFAVCKPTKEGSNGCVWVISKEKAKFVDFEKDRKPSEIGTTKFFYPRHVARRITSQAGLFSCHYFVDSPYPFFALNKNKNYAEHVRRIYIKAEHFNKIRDELDRSGVSEESLYLGLDGLCGKLRWRYLNK